MILFVDDRDDPMVGYGEGATTSGKETKFGRSIKNAVADLVVRRLLVFIMFWCCILIMTCAVIVMVS